MRDMELLNSYSQQMTHLVSAWTGTAMQAVANNLDNIQLGLDGFGLIPGIGEFADGANAIISAGRGDWANAGLSAAAMIPLLGNAATAGKIAKNAKEAEKALEGAKEVAKDVMKRPSSFRKKTVQDSWDEAAPGSKSGAKACPTCGKDVEVAPGQGRRDWDVDHQPPWSKRDHSGMDRKSVLDDFNSGTRLECPHCNRSRGAEPLE